MAKYDVFGRAALHGHPPSSLGWRHPCNNAIIDSIGSATKTAIQLGNGLWTLEQVTKIDLTELLNQIPLFRKVNFQLASIDGMTLVHSVNPYTVTFLGVGIGFSPDDRTYQADFSIDGKPLAATQIQPGPRGINYASRSQISFLNPCFKTTKQLLSIPS
jgi:hypothetical protein